MDKKLKDYLPLYYNSKVVWGEYNHVYDAAMFCEGAIFSNIAKDAKLILRPLNTMTSEEDKECHNIMFGEFATKVKEQNIIHYEGEKIRYLLSKGFDLFGLIEAGLAVQSAPSAQ